MASTPIDFRDVQVGDRLRFFTRDTGFGGWGVIERSGTVARITAKTIVITIDPGSNGPVRATAVIRRADWNAREPRKEA